MKPNLNIKPGTRVKYRLAPNRTTIVVAEIEYISAGYPMMKRLDGDERYGTTDWDNIDSMELVKNKLGNFPRKKEEVEL